MCIPALLVSALLSIVPVQAEVIDDAFNNALAAFERASPGLGAEVFGVDTAAYRDALMVGQFTSPFWGQTLSLEIRQGTGGDTCARYAAYVTLPPQDGAVSLTLCPQFVDGGTPALRTLTILHEMVHVVAGADEGRAMAFAARVEHLATGTYTGVDRYWQANNCDSSGFSLP